MLYTDSKKLWFLVSAFTALIFLFGYNLASAAWEDDLKAYWPLDGDSSDYTTNFSGTDTSVSYVAGKFDDALDMPNSASSYVTVGELELITEANKGNDLYYSFAGWVNPDAIGSDMRIVGKNSTNFAAPYTYYFLNIRTTGVVRACFGSACFDSTGTISASTWTHIAVNFHTHNIEGNVKLDVAVYFDGALDSSQNDITSGATMDQQSGLGDARIGLERFSTGQTDAPFNGLIDDLAIWNRALTTDEITDLQSDSLLNYLSAPPPSSTYISLLFPTEALELNANTFDRFGIAWEKATSSASFTNFQFKVATSTGNLANCPAYNESLGYLNGCWYTSAIYSTGTTTEQQVGNFFWPIQLPSSTYYGRVLMFDYVGGNYVEIASDGDVSFVINNEENAFESYFPVPETASTTDPDFGILGNFFKDVLKWLFVPPQGVFNLFVDIKEAIEDKPPIGYFTLITTSILSIDEEAPGEYELAAVGDLSFFQTIRTATTMLIWLGFGTFVFKRLKNLTI